MPVPIALQSLVDIYDQPFVILDRDHCVVLVNRAFEETYGVGAPSAAGGPCHALSGTVGGPYPCRREGGSCPFSSVLRRGVAQTLEHVYLDPAGHEHRVQIQAYPLRARNGEIFLGALIQRDALRHQTVNEQGVCLGARMVGEAPAFRRALEELHRAAGTDAPVLLLGETGTGKEMAAAYVHRHSARRDGPFQTLDCTALTEDLFESEVFGHERGAFTGSVGEKRGLFELADKGTLFLDEIGELPAPLQAKLLRVLESGEYRRVGSLKTRRADVRVICATNRQLEDSSGFRRDLYFRVACLRVRLPSLRERRSDIPLLVAELLDRISASAGRRFTVDESALERLHGYDYPGNIRELRNILWVAAVSAPDGRISAQEVAAALPEPRTAIDDRPMPLPPQCLGGLSGEIRVRLPAPRAWEADHLALMLRKHNGNRRAVAAELGVSERTVYRKIKRLGLN